MDKHAKLQNVKAAAEAVAVVAVLVATLTIVGELWSPLKDTLKSIFTHHWLGKSFLTIAAFSLVYGFRKNKPARTDSASRALYLATIMSLAATFAMLLFFVLHTLHII